MTGMFDTNSTNHGLTHFTFCSKSGSSHVTCNENLQRYHEDQKEMLEAGCSAWKTTVKRKGTVEL